jgi:hypothetical protein
MECNNNKCEMCFMPLGINFVDSGNEIDGTKSMKFCKYCYKNGKICYEGNDLKEFQDICYKQMLSNGMWKPQAWILSWTIQFAPYWKRKE